MKGAFISYSHEDSVFAERLARDLRDAGLEVWIDFRSIGIGTEWEQAIFKGLDASDLMLVCLTPPAVNSEWVRREVLLARSRQLPVIPLLVKKRSETADGPQETMALLRQYEETRRLPDIQMVDFERFGYERAFPMLLEQLPGVIRPAPATEPERVIDPARIPNPFKGLEAFQQTDAHLFFGREDLTQKLLDRLGDQRADRFLAVVGASGSGKSSLVRAGLIPKIRAGALPGSADWPLAIFTPGAFPIRALSLRLMPVVAERGLNPAALEVLEQGTEGLHVLAESLLTEAPRTTRLVLVIDQFEEVFTRASEREARPFLDLLHAAVTLPQGRALVVLTLRADFFDRLSGYPDLAALFEQESMVIAADMQPEALRRSIEGPAAVVGLAYDPGLVARILEEVRAQPGTLPLMEYALKRLYDRREGQRLTTPAYEAMGGVRGALAEHAEFIYAGLDATRQDMLRRLLVHLVVVSETGEATRRQVRRADLAFRGVPAEALDELIAQLTAPENRLLVVSRDIQRGDAPAEVTLEVSHEALIREWERYRDWIADDEAALRYGGDLLKDAQDWERAGRDNAYLLTGSRLAQARAWLEDADPTDVQREYVQASTAEDERQAQLKEQEQAEKLRLAEEAAEASSRAEAAERDRARRYQVFALIAGVAGVLAVLGVIWAGVSLSRVQLETTGLKVEQYRLSTLVPGIGQFPPTSLVTVAVADAFATATQIAVAYNAETPDDIIEVINGVEMVLVPPGCFYMGSNVGDSNERPVHEVCLEDFWIDRYEVTNAQYGSTGCEDVSSQPDQPRNCVDWIEARDYCDGRDGDMDDPPGVGVRLPTEAEWEYAARGPDSRVYPWGNEFVGEHVVYWENSDRGNGSETWEVGSRPGGVSWVGAYDMSGNVWEWVSSAYEAYSYTAASEREEEADSTDVWRVLRGGSFYFNEDSLRSAFRLRVNPGNGSSNVGFRCARS
jgi:formylglycine-generating enzyme required for sulfatase activity